MGADIERLPLFLRGGVLIGERGGEAEHAPSKDELYAHSHFGVRIKWNDAAIPLDRNALVDAERRPITAATNVQNAHVSVDYPNDNTGNTGQSKSFSIMPPYIGVCAWRRIE